jgi:hypothetical protein
VERYSALKSRFGLQLATMPWASNWLTVQLVPRISMSLHGKFLI